MCLPTSSRLFSQTYVLRGLIVGVLCFLPHKKGALFSNSIRLSETQSLTISNQGLAPQIKEILPHLYLAHYVFLPQRLNGSFPSTEILAQPSGKAEHGDSELDSSVRAAVNEYKCRLPLVYLHKTSSALSPSLGTYCISEPQGKVTPEASG